MGSHTDTRQRKAENFTSECFKGGYANQETSDWMGSCSVLVGKGKGGEGGGRRGKEREGEEEKERGKERRKTNLLLLQTHLA